MRAKSVTMAISLTGMDVLVSAPLSLTLTAMVYLMAKTNVSVTTRPVTQIKMRSVMSSIYALVQMTPSARSAIEIRMEMGLRSPQKDLSALMIPILP